MGKLIVAVPHLMDAIHEIGCDFVQWAHVLLADGSLQHHLLHLGSEFIPLYAVPEVGKGEELFVRIRMLKDHFERNLHSDDARHFAEKVLSQVGLVVVQGGHGGTEWRDKRMKV